MSADAAVLDELTRVLARACRRLGEAGHPQEAGRLAADGWLVLRASHPRESQRLDAVMHHVARLEQELDASSHPSREEAAMTTEDRVVDVRSQLPRLRHELIFETFGTLAPETAFVLINDHDPKPLYYQLAAENPGEFTWDYLEEGPEVWRVRIGRLVPA